MTSDSNLTMFDSLVRSTVGEFLRGKPRRLQNDKQDMIQECLLRLWLNASKIDYDRNPREYVRRLCLNTCSNYARNLRRDAIGDAVPYLPEEDRDDEM